MRIESAIRSQAAKRCCIVAVLLYLAGTASVRAAILGFLSTRGQNIANERGEKILLRGVGLGNWMLPEGYMWKFGNQGDRPRRIEKIVTDLIGKENAARFWSEYRKNYITEADIQRISALGYNSVRPALNSRLFLSESDKPERVEEGYQLLDSLVKWCKANGVYVIIDMHGAPGGQTGQNIDDSANDQPELFMQSKYQDQLVDLWRDIARRYKDEPAVAGYDLLNEPLPERTGAAAKYKSQVEPLYRRITAAIREVDSRHMIIVEGVDWANDWSVFTTPFDKNLVYQFHYYCWDTPAKLKDIKRYLDYRDRLNAPVWVGETGERDNTIYWATTEYFEANNIGWSFWPWKKMDAENGPVSIKRPNNWERVAAYSRGESKPSKEIAQKAFDELLANIHLENCVVHSNVVNAMFRRLPTRIEAENFGHDGRDVSYVVNDSARRSKFYRLDQPVMINTGESSRPGSNQFITLNSAEWVAYSINSDTRKECELTIRLRAPHPAQAQLQLADRTFDIQVEQTGWKEIKLASVLFQPGANRLKWVVTRGTFDLDWLDVNVINKPRETTALTPALNPAGAPQ